jgi:tetratricopeptide (TPR) repeat protein
MLLRATVLKRAGRFSEARDQARLAADLFGEYRGCGVADVEALRVDSLLALGNLHRIVGDLRSATDILSAAVVEAEQFLGPMSLRSAMAWNALGIVGKFTAEFDRAEAAYLRALEILESLGSAHLSVAGVLHNLGGLEHERGRPDPGIGWAARGLAIRESLMGTDHPDVAADLGALAALYAQAGRLDEARTTYERALDIFERRLGPDHYEVGVVCGNLAAVFAEQGEPDRAEAFYERSLRLKAAALGPAHPDMAVTLHNYAVFLADAGVTDRSQDLFGRAEQIMSANLPDGHPRLSVLRQTLHGRASATE